MAMTPKEPCTGSYTGDFDPRVIGPFKDCFDSNGKYIEDTERQPKEEPKEGSK